MGGRLSRKRGATQGSLLALAKALEETERVANDLHNLVLRWAAGDCNAYDELQQLLHSPGDVTGCPGVSVSGDE